MVIAGASELDKLNRLCWCLEDLLAKGPVYPYNYGRWRSLGWWRGIKDAFSSLIPDTVALLNALDLRKRELG